MAQYDPTFAEKVISSLEDFLDKGSATEIPIALFLKQSRELMAVVEADVHIRRSASSRDCECQQGLSGCPSSDARVKMASMYPIMLKKLQGLYGTLIKKSYTWVLETDIKKDPERSAVLRELRELMYVLNTE